MARSQEKSGNMLNRWLAVKGEELAAERGRPGGRAGFERRPRASECRDLVEADKWRAKLLREIGGKVLEVQNQGLGEERLRELNDEINKLLRVKWHWEKRIVELGGQNYLKEAPPVGGGGGGGQLQDEEVARATGKHRDYRYFGAAKLLPGIKELFEAPPAKRARKNRGDLHRCVDADYFGFRDEDDGELLRVEAEAEDRARDQLVEQWELEQMAGGGGAGAPSPGQGGNEAGEFLAYVPLPGEEEIKKQVLEKKKADLLAKYASDGLQTEQEEAKRLVGK